MFNNEILSNYSISDIFGAIKNDTLLSSPKLYFNNIGFERLNPTFIVELNFIDVHILDK